MYKKPRKTAGRMVSGKIRRWEYKQGWNLVRGNMDKHKKYRDKTAEKRGGEGEEGRPLFFQKKYFGQQFRKTSLSKRV